MSASIVSKNRDVRQGVNRSHLLGVTGPGHLVAKQALGLQEKVLAISLANCSATSSTDVGRGTVGRYFFPLTSSTIPGPIVSMHGYIGNAVGLTSAQGLRIIYHGNARVAASGAPAAAVLAEIANTGTGALRAVGSMPLSVAGAAPGWTTAPYGTGLPPNEYSNLALEVFSGAAVTDSANVLGAYARVVVQYQPMGVNPVVALPGASN